MLWESIILSVFLWAAPQANAPAVPDGYRIRAELTAPVTSLNAKTADTVKFDVLDDVKGSDGKVYIPKGAKLSGRVTLVQKRTDDMPQAQLAIMVDKAEWRGTAVDLHAYIVTLERIGVQAATRTVSENVDPNGTNSPRNPGLAQPPWMSSGSSATASREPVRVPKDCGLEKVDDPAIATVMVCDEQQVMLGPSARMVLRHKATP